MGDIDCDDFGIESAMRYVRKSAWKDPGLVQVDADDCAPELETEPDRFVGGVGCWDQDSDRSLWIPRHGGGADLVVAGIVVVEIEPLGPGWWIGAGWAGSDGFGGTLGEAKAHALAMLDRAVEEA